MPTHLSRLRLAGASMIIAAASVALTALPATAGMPVISASPTTLHAGDSIAVSGNCSYSYVGLGLLAGWTGPATPQGDRQAIATPHLIPTTGAWSDSITMPASAAPGSYTLYAVCFDDGNVQYQYANVEITVLPDETTTTTSTTSTTTVGSTVATPPSTTVKPAAAKPATAVGATPRYTG